MTRYLKSAVWPAGLAVFAVPLFGLGGPGGISMVQVLVFVAFVFSVIIHECAHGLMAHWCGDDTAIEAGRITLNPVSHIDPIFTIVLPAILLLSTGTAFGGAKPVPVNPLRLRNPRRDMMWVSWIGPMSNLWLAALFMLAINLAPVVPHAWAKGFVHVMFMAAIVNVVLAVFNLLPIPPLDGSGILIPLLPRELGERLESIRPYGLFIIFGLLWVGAFGKLIWPVGNLLVDWMTWAFVFVDLEPVMG